MSERETLIIEHGMVYAVAGRQWQLPGLAGRLRAVRYVGELDRESDLPAQAALAPVVQLKQEAP